MNGKPVQRGRWDQSLCVGDFRKENKRAKRGLKTLFTLLKKLNFNHIRSESKRKSDTLFYHSEFHRGCIRDLDSRNIFRSAQKYTVYIRV